MPKPTNVAKPYDWEHYENEFVRNENYELQELSLKALFASLPSAGNLPADATPNESAAPTSILEVGPGLGRITRLALAAFPLAAFSAADIAIAPLAEAERLSGGLEDSYLGSISASDFYQSNKYYRTVAGGKKPSYDLVIAIEVLMHVPPDELGTADANLYALTKPRGHLIVCDWTEPLPTRGDGSDRPVRVQNYRHDYMATLFGQDFELLYEEKIGYQTLRVFQR